MKYLINQSVYNAHFFDLLWCKTRYLVLYGGASSGKSFYVAQRYLTKIRKPTAKMNLLVVRQTQKSNRQSTFALFKQVIRSWNMWDEFKINQTDMTITCLENGNIILFSGCDDTERLKSLTTENGIITDIWVEEASEIEESDFNQLDVRLRGEGRYKQIVITFNPIDVNHWLKKRFIDVKSEDITVNKSTYRDNEHLTPEDGANLEKFKTVDPYYYDVYCLGNWGVLGNSIFNKNKINERLQKIPDPVATGYFTYDYDRINITNIRWVDDEFGSIKIYKKPEDINYSIGGDTAGEGSDWFVGQVLSQDGEQVAILRQQMDSDLWTKQMYCLGKYYNNALLAIEVNFDSLPITHLEDLGYKNMYIREVNDTALERYKKSYGFRTDKWTRMKVLNRLVEIVREHTDLFNDRITLEEMLAFVRTEKGKFEAQEGAHDDTVMAIAIAFEGLTQVQYKKPVPKEEEEYFEESDQLLDYWG